MNVVYRYVRAFFGALRMTLRGEKIPEPVQHPLVGWTKQLAVQVDEVYRSAKHDGFDQKAREALKLKLDGRLTNVEIILGTLRFHAMQEYPSLLKSRYGHEALNTLYASNFNDRYWIMKLSEIQDLQKPALQIALQRLKTHLEQIPPL